MPDPRDLEPRPVPDAEPTRDARGRRRVRAHRLGRAYFWLAAVPLVVPLAGLPDRAFGVDVFALGEYPVYVVDALIIGLALFAVPAALLLRRFPRRMLAHVAAFAAFLAWGAASAVWTRPIPIAAVEYAAYALVGFWTFLVGCLAASDPSRTETAIRWSVRVVDVVGLAVAAHQIVHGAWTPPLHAYDVNPRVFALFAFAPVSWHLSEWYHGQSRAIVPVALWTAAVFLSFSRLATGTLVVLLLVTVAVSYVARRARSPEAARPNIRIPGLMAVGLCVAVFTVDAFYDRLFVRDPDADALLGVDFSGRLDMWRETLKSGAESFFFGKGLGSNEVLIEELGRFGREAHPHNEYLQIWHDLGTVGLALFVAAMIRWLRLTARGRAPASDDVARLQFAAFLATVGFLCFCTAEQPFAHPAAIGAFAALAGAGIGAERAGEMSARDTPTPDTPAREAPDDPPAVADPSGDEGLVRRVRRRRRHARSSRPQ